MKNATKVDINKVIGLIDDGMSVMMDGPGGLYVIKVSAAKYRQIEAAIGAENVKFRSF